jgi:hypothetical protein
MRRARLAESLSGLAFVLWAVLILLVFLLLPLPIFPGKLNQALDDWIWVLLPMMPVLLGEMAVYQLRTGVAIREEKLAYKPEANEWSQLGARYASIGSVGPVISWGVAAVLAAAGLALTAVWLVQQWAAGPIALTRPFYVEAITVVAYFAVLRWPLAWSLRRVAAFLGSNRPKHTVEPDGVLIHNFMNVMGKQGSKYNARLRFDERDEIRELTDLEAESLVEYMIGPDLTLAAQATIERFKYLKGEIARPDHWVFTERRPGGKALCFRGPKVFYLLSVDSDDSSDLIRAFEAYRTKHTPTFQDSHSALY